ncbi:MAG: hypothetical protein QXJ14_02740, partial [Candidatus Aenigmatarchaeota archaeon]
MVIDYLTKIGEEAKKIGKGFVDYFKNIIPKQEEKEIKKEEVLKNPNITYFQNKKDTYVQPPGTYTSVKIDNENVKLYVESEIKEKIKSDELLQKELEQKGQTTFFYAIGEDKGKSIGYFVNIKKQGEDVKIDLKKGEQHTGAVISAEDLPMYVIPPALGLRVGLQGLQKGLTYAYTYSKGLELSNVKSSEDFGKFLAKTGLELGTAYGLSKIIQTGYDLYQKEKIKNLLEQKFKEGNLVLFREKGVEMQLIDTKLNKDVFIKKTDYSDWKLGIIEGKKELVNRIIYDKLDDLTYHIGIQKQQVKKIDSQNMHNVLEEYTILGKFEKDYSFILGEKTSLKIKPEKYLIKQKTFENIIKETDDNLYQSIVKSGLVNIKQMDVLRLMPQKELIIKIQSYKPKTSTQPTITSFPTLPTQSTPTSSTSTTQIKYENIPKTTTKEIKEIPEIKPIEFTSTKKTITTPITLQNLELNLELKSSEKVNRKDKESKEKEKTKVKEKEKIENIEKIDEKLEKIEKQKDKIKPPIFIFTPKIKPPKEREKEKEKLKTDDENTPPKIPELKIPKPPKPPEFRFKIPEIKPPKTKIITKEKQQKKLNE